MKKNNCKSPSRRTGLGTEGLLTGVTLIALCGPAAALTLGDISVRSHLGENFDGQVDFRLAQDEVADESCFRLASASATDSLAGLGEAEITMAAPSGRAGVLHIRTARPVYEPILNVVVQAGCPTLGQLQRQYTVLLDPPSFSPVVVPPIAAALPAAASPGAGAAIISTEQASAGNLRAAPDKSRPARHRRTAVASVNSLGQDDDRINKPATAATAKTKRAENFRLKLSTNEKDPSRGEKLTEQERAALREKLLLLDADDQVATLLALQNSVKQLTSQVAELQLKLNAATPAAPKTSENATTPPSVAPVNAVAPMAVTALPARVPTAGAVVAPPPAKSASPERHANSLFSYWFWSLLVGLLLVFAWLYRRRKHGERAFMPTYNFADQERAAVDDLKNAEHLLDLDFQTVIPSPEAGKHGWTPAPVDQRGLPRNTIINQYPELTAAGNTDAQTIIDVAWKCYDDNGERSRAIELIEFGVEKYPDTVDMWLTLFEFLRRDVRRSEYEQLLKHFLQRFPDSLAWPKIQAGGQFLDPDNPLYGDSLSSLPATKGADLDFDITGASNDTAAGADDSVERKTAPSTTPATDLSAPLDFTPALNAEAAVAPFTPRTAKQ